MTGNWPENRAGRDYDIRPATADDAVERRKDRLRRTVAGAALLAASLVWCGCASTRDGRGEVLTDTRPAEGVGGGDLSPGQADQAKRVGLIRRVFRVGVDPAEKYRHLLVGPGTRAGSKLLYLVEYRSGDRRASDRGPKGRMKLPPGGSWVYGVARTRQRDYQVLRAGMPVHRYRAAGPAEALKKALSWLGPRVAHRLVKRRGGNETTKQE